MKKLVLLGIVLAGITLFSLSYAVADPGTPNDEITDSTTGISSAGATITITMYAVADE